MTVQSLPGFIPNDATSVRPYANGATIYGGTASGGNMVLSSNTTGTPGEIRLAASQVLRAGVGNSSGNFYPIKLQTDDMAAPFETSIGMSTFGSPPVKDDLIGWDYNRSGTVGSQAWWSFGFESRYADGAPPLGQSEFHFNYTPPSDLHPGVSGYRPASWLLDINDHKAAFAFVGKDFQIFRLNTDTPTAPNQHSTPTLRVRPDIGELTLDAAGVTTTGTSFVANGSDNWNLNFQAGKAVSFIREDAATGGSPALDSPDLTVRGKRFSVSSLAADVTLRSDVIDGTTWHGLLLVNNQELRWTSGGLLGVNVTTPVAGVDVALQTATDKGLYIKQAGSHTGDYITLEDEFAAEDWSIDSAGEMTCARVSHFNDHIRFPAGKALQWIDSVATTRTVMQLFGDDVYIDYLNTKSLIFRHVATETARFDSGGLKFGNASGPSILNQAATSTVPTLIPKKDAPTTGIGHTGAAGSLIQGGVQVATWSSAAGFQVGSTQILSGNITAGAPLTVAPGGSNRDMTVACASGSSVLKLRHGSTDVITIPSTSRATHKKFLNLDAAGTALTIATGVVTATKSYHTIAGEGGADDDLATINGGAEGDILVIRASSDAVTITAKDGTGNLQLAGDFVMDSNADSLTLLFDGTNWLELCRSNNAA